MVERRVVLPCFFLPGVSLAGVPLVEVSLAGVPLVEVSLAGVPLARVPLVGVPLAEVSLAGAAGGAGGAGGSSSASVTEEGSLISPESEKAAKELRVGSAGPPDLLAEVAAVEGATGVPDDLELSLREFVVSPSPEWETAAGGGERA